MSKNSDVATPLGVKKPPLIQFYSPSEIAGYEVPDGWCLVGDNHIQRTAPFVIAGPPGVGKSRLTTELAFAGAAGADWMGLEVHRRFRTMIVQAENGRPRLQSEYAERGIEVGLDDWIRVSDVPHYGFAFDHPDFKDQIAKAIKDFRPEVFILDPWNRLADDDKAANYREAFDHLLAVLPDGDERPAIGIVAHTRKPGADERASGRALLHTVAGSYMIGSIPRAVWVLQSASDDVEDRQVVLTCCKNNDGLEGKRSAWQSLPSGFYPVEGFDWKAFDAKTDRRKDQGIQLEDLGAVFDEGETRLNRKEAVRQLKQRLGCGQTAAYEATDPVGRFADHLRLVKPHLYFRKDSTHDYPDPETWISA